MSYFDRNTVFSAEIQELSIDEIGIVCGGESPSYSLTGQGPQLSPLTAAQVTSAAGAVAVSAQAVAYKSTNPAIKAGAEGVALVATAVSVVAGMVSGN